ncbi:MAG: hypothetical protein HY904_05155 [Deltaproteobacteria bacterium]|nr:hypothetical protein [Deltaproteobacteria bacterium]
MFIHVVVLPLALVSQSTADAGPAAAEDAFTRAVLTALTMHKRGDDALALRSLWEAVDDARVRAPLDVHTGLVLDSPPENLGLYREAKAGMVFGETLLLYAEVDNHGLRRTPAGWEMNLWTDLFILDENGKRLGGRERFGEQVLTARAPYRTTHLVLEVGIAGLPPGAYRAQVVVHDDVGAKTGSVVIPFRVAARPGRNR